MDNISNYTPVTRIEIKCPSPGKIYTTPVHYVLQILSEKINISSLLFVNYSNQITVVLFAQFDNTLLNDVWSFVRDLYPVEHAKYPKTLHLKIEELGKALKTFLLEIVEKIMRNSISKGYSVGTSNVIKHTWASRTIPRI